MPSTPIGRKRLVGEDDTPLLRVRGLKVSFPQKPQPLQAVRGLDFELKKGSCLGIVGESGSGKSVTATALLGLLHSHARIEGDIRLKESEISELSFEEKRTLRGRHIAMIFQEPSRSFDPIYNIGKTFEETFKAKNPTIGRQEAWSKAEKLLSEVHIPDAKKRLENFPHQFSGGMLQRIMIALALANDPEILIADEPTTALDVTIQIQIVRLLKELQESRGLSLIFISHDLGLVAQVSDEIMVLYGGLVLERGPTVETLSAPKSPYTRALLRALPEWGKHYSQDRLYTIPGTVPDPTNPLPGCPFEPRCFMRTADCSIGIPSLRKDADTTGEYRCLFPGVKS